MQVAESVGRRIASKDFMNYDDIGFLRLREILTEYLGKHLGITCSPEEIVITSGVTNALYIISAAFLGRFTSICYESPSYYDPIITSFGATAVPLYMEHGGIRAEELKKVLSKNRHAFFLTTPVCHWPSCHMTEETNKKAQYAVCRDHDTPIVEVDVMRGQFDAPPPMRSYAGSGQRIIYVGGLTNTIGHSLRLTWIVAPRSTIKRLLEVKSQVEPRISTLIQIYAEEILSTGAYEQYLNTLQENVRIRNEDTEKILERHLTGCASWHGAPSVSRLITMNKPLSGNAIIKMQGRQISLLPLRTLDKTLASSLYLYCVADPLAHLEHLIGGLGQMLKA